MTVRRRISMCACVLYLGNIDFHLAPNSLQYLSTDMDLLIEGRVVLSSGDTLAADSDVALLNCFGSFSAVLP